jgi:hypothetical protein
MEFRMNVRRAAARPTSWLGALFVALAIATLGWQTLGSVQANPQTRFPAASTLAGTPLLDRAAEQQPAPETHLLDRAAELQPAPATPLLDRAAEGQPAQP